MKVDKKHRNRPPFSRRICLNPLVVNNALDWLLRTGLYLNQIRQSCHNRFAFGRLSRSESQHLSIISHIQSGRSVTFGSGLPGFFAWDMATIACTSLSSWNGTFPVNIWIFISYWIRSWFMHQPRDMSFQKHTCLFQACVFHFLHTYQVKEALALATEAILLPRMSRLAMPVTPLL